MVIAGHRGWGMEVVSVDRDERFGVLRVQETC